MRRLFSFFKVFFDKKEIVYVNNDVLFSDAINEIKKDYLIGVDTEFIWRNTYFPSLSLIQISNHNKIFIFDLFEINNLLELKRIFESNEIKKIFHSLRSDISVLKTSLGMQVRNVFDTQIAESILDNNFSAQIGYKDLVNKYFLISISKDETNSDWNKRPLKKNQIEYAANDVRYLIRIMKSQTIKLKKMGLMEDFDNLCSKEKDFGEEDFSISRLNRLKKKNRKLTSLDEKIFLWREEEAKIRNLPPNNIFKINHLNRLAEVIQKKDFKECTWIIRDEDSRNRFILNFK
jgi:ribonuclease D